MRRVGRPAFPRPNVREASEIGINRVSLCKSVVF